MSTTVDDLIDLKNDAVDACGAIVAAWENRQLDVIEKAVEQAKDVGERAELYDAADEDDTVCSVEELEEKQAPQREYERLIGLGWSKRDAARHMRLMERGA
jgi:hypothetical protein